MTTGSAKQAERSWQSRRRGLRTHVPSIEIEIAGERHACTDWSLGGCRIVHYEGDLRPGDRISVSMYLRIGRAHDGLSVEAEILRYEPDEENGLAMRFDGVDGNTMTEFCRAVEVELREEEVSKQG